MIHPLRRFCVEAGVSQAALARAACVSEALVCQAISGKTVLGRRAALRLEVATGGKVTRTELLADPEEARAVRASVTVLGGVTDAVTPETTTRGGEIGEAGKG
jgi:DNA-binding transcriptional regulator YdaS (Cro superfamily)